MDIRFNCPRCGQHLSVEEKGAGMTVNCRSCKEPIEIPRGTAQQLPKAPAPTALSRLATLPPSSRWRLAGYLAELIQSYDQSEFGLRRPRTPEDLNRPIATETSGRGDFILDA